MSKVTSISRSKDAIEVASSWVAKLERGLSSEENAELKLWLNESETNKAAFLRLVTLWDKMESLSKLSDLFEHHPAKQDSKKALFVSIAASVVVVCTLMLGAFHQSNFFIGSPEQQIIVFQNSYSTSVGEQATVYLQDKTELQLNTNSAVKVTYTDKQRVIELVKGELYVDVAHNKQKPLSVYAVGTVFQAVGTAFNIEMTGNNVELLVTDGRVLVSELGELPETGIKEGEIRLSSDALSVSKGEKVNLDEKSKVRDLTVGEINEFSADLAWQQGQLIFRGEKLVNAMKEVSRYTDSRFEFASDEIRHLQIAGLFKIDDINGLLKSLEYNFDVKSTVSDTGVITLGKKSAS